jgi:DNA-binding transcriptional MerR regulator
MVNPMVPLAAGQQPEKLAFTRREVQAALGGISTVTLWRLEKRGLLRPVQGIRHRIYARTEIERFLDRQTRAA